MDPNIEFSSAKVWPVCPQCHGHDLLTQGIMVSCLSCSWRGDISVIQKLPAVRYSTSKTAVGMGALMSAGQFGPFPQYASTDFGGTLGCYRNEMYAVINSHRYFDKARDYWLKYKSFPPMAVTMENTSFAAELLPLNNRTPAAIDMLKRNAANKPIVLVIYTADSPNGSFIDDDCQWNKDGKYLVMNVHMMNVPPLNMATEIAKLPEVWGELPELILPDQARDIIWQPVDWNTLRMDRKSATLRYAAGFESKSGVNATFAVEENLDNGTFRATGTIRAVGDPHPLKTKEYASECKDSDAAIDLVTAKFKEVQAKNIERREDEVFQFDIVFGIERSSRSITNEIAEQPFWEDILANGMKEYFEKLHKKMSGMGGL